MNNFEGITDNNKPSSKVLRPPGGGSSDIFGADLPQTARTVKNRMQSNIFSCEQDSAVKNNGDAPRRGQKNMDSYTRLFGAPDRPITPSKNHLKSNIPFGANTEAAQQLITNGNGHYINGKSGSVSSASSSVSSSTENLKMNGVSRSEGNPVTGEGYKPGGNDFTASVPVNNGAKPVVNKNRVPPGGYSAGLW